MISAVSHPQQLNGNSRLQIRLSSVTCQLQQLNMKKIIITLLTFFSGACAFAQPAANLKTYRVGIFAPLYLDSVFDGKSYKYGKNFPRFTQQGLDFVQGAEIALDSMPMLNANIITTVYDSKAEEQTIPVLADGNALDTLDLIIGSVKDAEFLQLAAFAKKKNIPFISATYPNDGGVTANPFLVIENSTLRAHCETIYSYLLQNHGTDKIFLCRKKGGQEDKIADYFKAINEADGKPLLSIQVLNFEDDFTMLKSKLDSNRKTVLIGGSLNEDFANSLADAAYALKKTYAPELIGMPNWDGFDDLKKASYKDFPVIFTTTYNNSKTDAFSKRVQNNYLKKYNGAPSDMSYKGFETAWIFIRLFTKYPDDFMSHLNDPANKVFCDYNFKPVYLNKKSGVPDYFENKHLYFMKIMNGRIVKGW